MALGMARASDNFRRVASLKADLCSKNQKPVFNCTTYYTNLPKVARNTPIIVFWGKLNP